jgi:hypothetical protein
MGALKVLGGLGFLAIGIVLLVIAFAPIPGLENVSFTSRLMTYINSVFIAISSLNISSIIGESGWLYIAAIIPWCGYHFCKAGIKSMTYTKKKKQYYYSETKIGWLIFGFILICIAVTLLLTIFFEIMAPAFQFIVDLIPTIPAEFAFLLPQLLIPVVLTILIIFFVYWIGSKIMKSGIKKEELLK